MDFLSGFPVSAYGRSKEIRFAASVFKVSLFKCHKGPIIAGRKNVAYHVQCLCMYEHGYTQDTSGQMVILFGRFRSFVIFVLILNCKEEL